MSESAAKFELPDRPAKDQRRQEILDAAFAEFAEKGYPGASMEAIARRARASKETLYAWFKNKETLFNTLFSARLDSLNSRVADAVKVDPSPAHVLPVIAEDVLRVLLAVMPLSIAVGAAGNGNKAARLMGKTIMEERKNFANYFLWCKQQSYIAFDDDPFELASLFVAMAQGEWTLRMGAGMVREVTDTMIRDHAAFVTRIFLKALKPAK